MGTYPENKFWLITAKLAFCCLVNLLSKNEMCHGSSLSFTDIVIRSFLIYDTLSQVILSLACLTKFEVT